LLLWQALGTKGTIGALSFRAADWNRVANRTMKESKSMGRHRTVFPLLLTTLAVLGVGLSYWLSRHKPSEHVMWTAGPGEKIYCIQSGMADGHVLIASELNGTWVLRDVDIQGRAAVMASGSGSLQQIGAITRPNRQAGATLVGLGRVGESLPRRLVECDLSQRRTFPILMRDVPAWNMHQPYSPDGQSLALLSSGPTGEPLTRGSIWVMNRQTRRVRLILNDDTTMKYLAWASDGTLYVYLCRTGQIMAGKPPTLVSKSKLPSGAFASFAPDGQHIVIFAHGPHTHIVECDIASGKCRTVYKTAVEYMPLSIAYFADGRRFAIGLVRRSNQMPVIVGSDGSVLKSKENQTWNLGAGLAILRPNLIAAVRLHSNEAPEQVVMFR